MRSILLFLIGMSMVAHAASPLPANKWTVEASAGSRATLSDSQGNLAIDAQLVPYRVARCGHRSFHYAYVDLLLDRPVPLGDEIERIAFEAVDLRGKHSGSEEVRLRPIVRDADGERLVFDPKPYPHLQSGGETWSKWTTTSFYAGEAGAATQDIYMVEGQGGNTLPDPPLELIGFKVTLRIYTRADNPAAEEAPTVKARLALGDFEALGGRLPYETPFAYADAFLADAGTYTLAMQVRNAFQALPVREFKRTVDFDPEDLGSRKQKLEIPLGPDDNYWIDYQITAADGALVAGEAMRHQVFGNPDTTTCTPVDPASPPALGHLRINPAQATHGVYEQGQPLAVQVRVFPRGQAQLNVAWRLLGYTYDDVFDQGAADVAFAGKPFVDLALTPKPQAGRDAYRLEIDVQAAGKAVDRQTYFLGFRTDHSRRHDRAGELADRHEIKKQPYNRTTYLIRNTEIASEDAAEQHFREYLAQASEIARSLTYMIDLRDFEVLPGVFDFAVLDRIMDAAADYGCKVTVRLAHADRDRTNLYRWPKYSRQFNYDGTVAPGHLYYGAYAVTDPQMQELWLDSYRALFDRYQQHTAFEGYYIMQPGGEWTVVDQPWNGAIAGYSRASAIGFREFMKTTEGLALAEVNQRWGTAYAAWDDIQPPLPDLRGGATPDLRLQWVDFNRFKSALGTDVWFPKAVRSIREYDDRRITIIYGNPKQYEHLTGLLDYGHNGGNHYGRDLGEYIEGWNTGRIGWITEPHHPHRWAAYGDPAERGWVLDWSVWVMTAQAAGGGSNLHIYYYPTPSLDRVAHYGGAYAYDAFERFKPILSELHRIELDMPPRQVAVHADRYTLYCKHRTTFSARLDDLRRWFELLQVDSVPYAQLDADHLADYRLVLPNILDTVISPDSLDMYVKAVQGGASMIVTANTGKYVPDLGSEPFQLLKALGIKPPTGAYSGKGAAVTATVGTDDPLFFTPGQTIPFQTTDSFRAQLATEDVRKNFWKYRYRWIPETDYFGYYPGQQVADGQVVARFADGGAAVSVHPVGKGRVVVFWGTPDIGGDNFTGMMARAADWAGVVNPLKDNPLRYMVEGHNDTLKRHYLLVYNETPGTYVLKVRHIGDGEWFLDDPVANERLGRARGADLREQGVKLTWDGKHSPLKIVRMIGVKATGAAWPERYPVVSPPNDAEAAQ